MRKSETKGMRRGVIRIKIASGSRSYHAAEQALLASSEASERPEDIEVISENAWSAIVGDL